MTLTPYPTPYPLNSHGEIETGVGGSTSVPKLFAVGDVTNGFGKRIIIAAGDGARAALAAGEYIQARRDRSVTAPKGSPGARP